MSMFSTGLSGLNAAQNALQATSNNISNVFTPGYNRELPLLSENAGGQGVRVDAIERQFNQYVASQLNGARTQSTALEKYTQQIGQIDDLLADRDAGLAPLMQNFFSSIEDLASAPSDSAARQGVVGTAQTLSAQFRSFDGYLEDMHTNINQEIKDEITQINNATKQLANFNREISLARARNGEAPNSLLNQRDHLVAQLNERLDTRLNVQDGKTYNVSLPNGQPLVTGTDSFKLVPTTAATDPQRTVIGYRDGGGKVTTLQENAITGGSLGGLMRFREEALDDTRNHIGQLAVSLTTAFNETHKQGFDLEGRQGKDFFSIGEPQAFSHQDNTAEVGDIRFIPQDVDALEATDYQVTYRNNAFEVTRADTGEAVDSKWDGTTLRFGGIGMTLSAPPAQGDTFEVQPVRQAAAGMDVNISDLDRIAAALGPVQPMPYSRVDFQGQSEDRLGETQSIQNLLQNGSSKSDTSGIRPFGFIPAGTKNFVIETNHLYQDDDIQIFTQSGKHLIGTPLQGSEADITWTVGNNQIDSAAAFDDQVLTERNGFAPTASYDDSDLLTRNSDYSADLANGATLDYNGMTLTYTGDSDRLETPPNNGVSNEPIEKVQIDNVTEPLFVVITGQGSYNVTASWDDMPGTPASGGAAVDTTPTHPVQSQLEVSNVNIREGFDAMPAEYRPPSFAVNANDDGSLELGFFGADGTNNLFVSPDAGAVPSNPPPEGVFSVYKADGTEINNVLSVNSGGADTLAPGEQLTIKDDATGETVLSFTVDQLPTGGTSGVAFTGRSGTTGPGDNRNALELQDLQTESLVGGSASFSGAYGAMVSEVGNRTQITQVNLDARQGLTEQLKAVQQSESGVNFDEEAANLIKYQQFYQANARVIDTASSVLDTILALKS